MSLTPSSVDQDEQSPFDYVPPEILLLIFSHLDPKTLNRVAGVCRYWETWSRDEILWRKLYRAFFSSSFTTLVRVQMRAGFTWHKAFRSFLLAQAPVKRNAILNSSLSDQRPVRRVALRGAMASAGPTVLALSQERVPTLIFRFLPFDMTVKDLRSMTVVYGYVVNIVLNRCRPRSGDDAAWSHPRSALEEDDYNKNDTPPEEPSFYSRGYVKYLCRADAEAAAAGLADLAFDSIPVGVSFSNITNFNPIDGYL